ncbi:uncharacterized protein BDW43DRAFT_271408 [Aspergillus alliaceus]|uniref:uncharacterized protein n=1 Tax=Petromyces alliaceus TaxID=209559 RepID=UPI0012A63AC5|nr:uncharacterized protein BDW43DRAFT_271408 [Aspergillus alliaceus]KAB8235255.1 hypothetical protein BDW43DRAFT_271408 [Aspergillus alliaceus]
MCHLIPKHHHGGISVTLLRHDFRFFPHRGIDWPLAIKCWGRFSASPNRRLPLVGKAIPGTLIWDRRVSSTSSRRHRTRFWPLMEGWLDGICRVGSLGTPPPHHWTFSFIYSDIALHITQLTEFEPSVSTQDLNSSGSGDRLVSTCHGTFIDPASLLQRLRSSGYHMASGYLHGLPVNWGLPWTRIREKFF